MGRTDIKYNVETDDIELSAQQSSNIVVSTPGTWHQHTIDGNVRYGCHIDVTGITDEQLETGIIVEMPYQNNDDMCYICYYKNGSPYSPHSWGQQFIVYASVCGAEKTTISPCRLKIVNPNDKYLVKLVTESSSHFIMVFSAVRSDLIIRQVIYQDAFLIMKCEPGNMHRYPLIGGKISDMINNCGDYNTMAERIVSALSSDGIVVEFLSVDPETGKLEIVVQ